jgi:hypothetical protein
MSNYSFIDDVPDFDSLTDVDSLHDILLLLTIPDSDGVVFLANINAALNTINNTALTEAIFVSSPAHDITAPEVVVLSNTSGVNTGDETVTTIETKLGVSATNVTALSNLTGINAGDETNSSILSKLSINSISGVNTGDETASTIETKLGVSATNVTALSNLTGINAGDETASTIKTKLGITTLSGDNTGDQNISGLMVKANNLSDVASQQTALNNVTNVMAASDEQIMTKDTGTGNAVFKANPSEPALATVQQLFTPGLSDSGSSGSAVFSQLFEKVNYKNVIVYCDSLVGASTYVFPTAFVHIPSIVNTPLSSIVTALTNTGVTVTGAGGTGFIELIGF